MKKLLAGAWLALGFTAAAQDAVTVVANETCDCVSKLQAQGEPLTDMQVGLCMVKAYSAHKSEFPPSKQVAVMDSPEFEEITSEIGMKMVETCPDILLGLAESGVFDDQPHAIEVINVSGIVSDITTGQFAVIEMKDEKGKKYSLLLLDYFETASVFTDGIIKKGDRITASYTEAELYDPKLKEFRPFKILTALSK